MSRKKKERSETPNRVGPTGNAGREEERPGEEVSAAEEAPSRISAAIMRILASARGATEGRRAVTAADLSPARPQSSSANSEEASKSADAASGVEWTLRMMQ